MKHLSKIFLALILTLVVGCSASSTIIGPVTLPTSGKIVDVVQHRSDSHGCAELVVIQTFDAAGILLDSQQGRARSLPCTMVEVGIEAGSRVGSAALIANGLVKAAKATRPDNVDINNSNSQAQGQDQKQNQVQGQAQGQLQGQISTNVNANSNSNRNVWHGGNVKNDGGHGGGEGGGHGNNGGGNGDGDGTNPGTGHHHDNGDNN